MCSDETNIIALEGFKHYLALFWCACISVFLTSSRVLSRAFFEGGGGGFEPRGSEKRTFWGLSRGVQGHAPSENFENIVFRIG